MIVECTYILHEVPGTGLVEVPGTGSLEVITKETKVMLVFDDNDYDLSLNLVQVEKLRDCLNKWLEERGKHEQQENCLCCSCYKGECDPFCRKHGFTTHRRRCEEHKVGTCKPDDGYPLASIEKFLADK